MTITRRKPPLPAWAFVVSLLVLTACASGPSASERAERLDREYEAKEQRRKDEEAEAEAERIRRIEAQTDWDDETKEMVRKKQIAIGMTAEQLELSWGPPREKNRTVTQYGTSEQWVYWYEPHTEYVYLDDGKISGWQNSR